jgi:hypothetical protein
MPVTQSPRPATPFRRQVTAAFTERLGLKAAAIFFACVLWLVVGAAEPTEELVPVRFAPALDPTLELQNSPPQVRALVIGRGRELLKLYSEPPVVRRTLTGDVPDTVTLELRPIDVDIPPGIDAIVRDVRPRRISLQFAPRVTRTLPVQSDLRFIAQPGLRVAGDPRFEPDSVRVTGDRKTIARMTAIKTVAADLSVGDSAWLTVPLDTSGLDLRVRPAQVRVSIPTARDPSFMPPSVDSAPAAGERGAPPPARRDSARGAAKRDSTR